MAAVYKSYGSFFHILISYNRSGRVVGPSDMKWETTKIYFLTEFNVIFILML
jgi:hypothetical protein